MARLERAFSHARCRLNYIADLKIGLNSLLKKLARTSPRICEVTLPVGARALHWLFDQEVVGHAFSARTEFCDLDDLWSVLQYNLAW